MDRATGYGMLSDMLFRGFLTVNIEVCNRSYVLKTVNEKEFELIKILAGSPERKDFNFRFNVFFMIYSLLFLDGENILLKRTEQVQELFGLFSKFPNTLFNRFITHSNQVRTDLQDAINYLEGMCYTEQSRLKWKILNNGSPTGESFTGIAGTSTIGINACQEQWILINRMLDEEEQNNHDLSMALLVASASNPKGSRHIRSQHESNVKQAAEQRQKLADNGLKEAKPWRPDGWAAPVDTTEELLAELERQMSDLKDKHDIFIENHLRKLREAAEKRTREAAERLQKIRDERKDKDVYLSGEQRVLTPEEAAELMGQKKSPLINVKDEEFASNDDKKNFLKRVGATVITGKR